MCFNSPTLEAEVRRRGAEVIGGALGVIVGWETLIGRDFATGRALGYCTLTNRGLRRGASREDMDQARIAAVERFISIWSETVASASVPQTQIYSHIAFIPLRQFDSSGRESGETYAQRINFSPPESAFGAGRRAGFSTYPNPGLMEGTQGGAPGMESDPAPASRRRDLRIRSRSTATKSNCLRFDAPIFASRSPYARAATGTAAREGRDRACARARCAAQGRSLPARSRRGHPTHCFSMLMDADGGDLRQLTYFNTSGHPESQRSQTVAAVAQFVGDGSEAFATVMAERFTKANWTISFEGRCGDQR